MSFLKFGIPVTSSVRGKLCNSNVKNKFGHVSASPSMTHYPTKNGNSQGYVTHFWATVCKTVRPMLSDRCLSCSVCNVGVLWPNGWTDQDET